MTDIVAEQAGKASSSMEDFQQKWHLVLKKQLAKIEALQKELLSPEETELSVTAQVIINSELNKLRKLLEDLSTEHRHIHMPVSKCGRELDKNFQTDLSDIIKNQKDLDAHPECFEKVNGLIFDHLLSLGRMDVADTFMRESELHLDLPNKVDVELIKRIMGPFKRHDYLPAIEWVSEHAPSNKSLLFKLHKQQILQLVTEGRRSDALAHSKHLQQFARCFPNEISNLMFVIVHYPNVNRHGNLFLEGTWLELEEELSGVLCGHEGTPLSTLMQVGASAIPNLLSLRKFVSKRVSGGWLTDELPTEVPISTHVHSTFTCPILKVQTTDDNYPARLKCGHVISSEAVAKLMLNSRGQKLKCPYCPEESLNADIKRVFF